MGKPASKVAAPKGARPKLGACVVIRFRYVPRSTVGIVVGLYDEDTEDVVVQAFPVGRETMQIPAIPFYRSEPDDDVQAAVWPA